MRIRTKRSFARRGCRKRLGSSGIFWCCVLLAAALVFGGCAAHPTTEEIHRFSYTVGSGWGYHTYTIEKEAEKIVYRSEGQNSFDGAYEEETGEIPQEALDALQRILREHNILAWNGFSKEEKGVVDGDGFTLEIEYADGTCVSARGYRRYPDGFDEANAALIAYFSELSSSLGHASA